MRTTLPAIAWVFACLAIGGLLFAVELDVNFFIWNGVWHLQSIASLGGVLFLLLGTYFLAALTKSTATVIIAAVSCVLLLAIAIYFVTPEPLGNPGQWFARRYASPAWYRWSRLTIAAIPFVMLCSRTIRGRHRLR